MDHFDLSRETVAISLSLFDRYMATLGNECTGSTALLTSLATLFVAVKINETKTIHLRTLADLSRRQFTSKDIEEMELRLLTVLSWRVNPPTSVAFVHHLLKFVPSSTSTHNNSNSVHRAVQRDLFELSRYVCELALADVYFCDRRPSSVAYAAILNVMDFMASKTYLHLPAGLQEGFVAAVGRSLGPHGLDPLDADVEDCRARMSQAFGPSLELYANDGSLELMSLRKGDRMDCSTTGASVGSKGSGVDSKTVGSSLCLSESPPRAQ